MSNDISSRDPGKHPVSALGADLPSVSFAARFVTVNLSSGRVVSVGRSEDGEHWALRVGDPEKDSDAVRFALSNEAYDGLIRAMNAHAELKEIQLWTYTHDTPTDGENRQDGIVQPSRDEQ